MKTLAIQLDKLKREPASLSSKKSDSARTPFIHRAHDPSRHHVVPSASVNTGISLKQAVTLSEASRPRSPSVSSPAVTLRGRDPAIRTPQSTARATKVAEHGKIVPTSERPVFRYEPSRKSGPFRQLRLEERYPITLEELLYTPSLPKRRTSPSRSPSPRRFRQLRPEERVPMVFDKSTYSNPQRQHQRSRDVHGGYSSSNRTSDVLAGKMAALPSLNGLAGRHVSSSSHSTSPGSRSPPSSRSTSPNTFPQTTSWLKRKLTSPAAIHANVVVSTASSGRKQSSSYKSSRLNNRKPLPPLPV